MLLLLLLLLLISRDREVTPLGPVPNILYPLPMEKVGQVQVQVAVGLGLGLGLVMVSTTGTVTGVDTSAGGVVSGGIFSTAGFTKAF